MRARDSDKATAQAARDAQRLQDAWMEYLATSVRLASIRPCEALWPASHHDVAPTQCQLVGGHDGPHRYRPYGDPAAPAVEWP